MLFTVPVVVALSQLPEIRICCPLYPHPQKVTESVCCKTIPEEITDGSRNCADDFTEINNEINTQVQYSRMTLI